jgi:hypothetical protein
MWGGIELYLTHDGELYARSLKLELSAISAWAVCRSVLMPGRDWAYAIQAYRKRPRGQGEYWGKYKNTR